MSDNIKVVVKVRPLISREIDQKLSYQWRVTNDTLHQLDHNGKLRPEVCFTFDKVYDQETKTREVYDDIAKPIVEAAIAGFNGTIFAYGQTSSGKTFTMTGTEESPGIIPLAVVNLFDIIKSIPNRDFLVRVSYIEIYNETVKDLLNMEKKNIKVHDTLQGVKVDATERPTASPDEVLEAMKEGEANRQTGATNMNEESSRSHTIFQITVESREHLEGDEEVGCVNVSQLNLVDLAGSERSGQTGATGLRFKEGTHINKSLSVLALVIKQLSDGPTKHANYRDSKLTRILQNSLGGNAKTSIVCAVTPASVEETVSTLQFANRAKAIKNKPTVNAVATDATEIHSLTKKLSQLQSQLESKKNLEVMLESKKNVEQDNVNLQKQIDALKKLIINGFGQSNRLEMMSNSRKKWQQPHRRITISTLHPIQEDSVPTVPKFCTPSLKYNPLTLPGSIDFLPIQTNKLSSLPEECNRMVTPPPYDKNVNFGEEIIEIDSDDDNGSEGQACSPYHKCFNSSTTPPCILRKTAKQAEQSLKDIQELTKREKMYTPSVVELMEKLEHNSNIISRLEEEVNTLTKESKGKDSELNLLKNEIKKTQDEIKIVTSAKCELEAIYNTKVTDWEVSYETLKKKSKTREDELLSLLEEQKSVKTLEDIGKLASKPIERELLFMDMSKDISLVNSDNESSTANVNDDDTSMQIQDIVVNMQSQLTDRNQTISDLEANIFAEKQKIQSLENTSQELQGTVNSLKDKLAQVGSENLYLKTTVENLNTTIESQKHTLETINNDIKSYNSLIQELQIKLTKKDDILNLKIDDSMLENMVANEENFLANNENMKNIIQSFRMLLDTRQKEISNLKLTLKNSYESLNENVVLKEQVGLREKQISVLIEEAESLKDQLSENNAMINKLMTIEQETAKKLIDTKEENETLQRLNEENATQIEKLSQIMTEKEFSEIMMSAANEDLTKQIEDISLKVIELEKDINLKDNIITTLTNTNKVTDENLVKARSIINKLQQLTLKLGANNDKVPDTIENFEIFFNILNVTLDDLEIAATQVTEGKIQADSNTAKLKEELSTLVEKHQSEFASLQMQIEKHTKEQNDMICQHDNFLQHIDHLTGQLDKIHNEVDMKNNVIDELQTKLKDAVDNNKNLRDDLLSRDNTISSLQEKTNSLNSEVLTLQEQGSSGKTELEYLEQKLHANQESFKRFLNDKDNEISEGIDRLKAADIIVEEKRAEIITLTNIIDDLKKRQESFDQILGDKEKQISEESNNSKNIEFMLEEKRREVVVLRKQIEDIRINMDESNKYFNQISDKDNEIAEINNSIKDVEIKLEAKHKEVTALTEKLNNAIDNRNYLLETILNKTSKLIACDSNNQNNSTYFENDNANTFEQIMLCLDKISNRITVLTSENESNDIKNVLSHTREQITELAQKNVDLIKDFSTIDIRSQELLADIEQIKAINDNLSGTNELLEEVKLELSVKTKELENIELKARELKVHFVEYESIMKQQMQELHIENERLKNIFPTSENVYLELNNDIDHPYQDCTGPKSESNVAESLGKQSPQSLLTICCNKIIDHLQPSETEQTSTSTSKSSVEIRNAVTPMEVCQCIELSLKLKTAKEKNRTLRSHLQYLESANETLIKEQEETRKEVELLLEPAKELQKKIVNHRTNLSTSTATTYAENKLLNSQLKVLKHHHNRYIHVCQRDLPAFKSQLHELMTIIKGNTSLADKENISFKRYSLPDVFDNNTTLNNFKNESTLDGDLLMLDTNVTLTTSADNTLLGYDQTCLDVTQANFDNEIACQANDVSKVLDPCLIYSQMEALATDNQRLYENLESLKEENTKLRDEIEKYSVSTTFNKVDAQISPIKVNNLNENNSHIISDSISCENCRLRLKSRVSQDKLFEEMEKLSQELMNVKTQKENIEYKYSILALEIRSTDALDRKADVIQEEYSNKLQEITKITNDLEKKANLINYLQEENNTLSEQLMENISENDNLRKDVELLKNTNNELTEKFEALLMNEPDNGARLNSSASCYQCTIKDQIIKTLRIKHKHEQRSILNRSLSDSDSSSRHNKICTLQQELHESKEDCKQITEEVATIKNHLDRSNLSICQSMDLDESMNNMSPTGDGNIFTFTRAFGNIDPQLNKSNLVSIPEEDPADLYALDKICCFNYYIEKTGADKENLNCDVKIVDIMKMLYDNLITKQSNQVENVHNVLRDFEDSRNRLQEKINNVKYENSKITKELQEKDNNLKTVTNFISLIKNNVNVMNEELSNITEVDHHQNFVAMFKENILNVIDTQLDLSIGNTFESLMSLIVCKHQEGLNAALTRYTTSREHMENIMKELNKITDDRNELKSQLSSKEDTYNVLQVQKQKIQEICNAVTLDIIKKEQDLYVTITNGCKKLIALHIISPEDIDLSHSVTDKLDMLFKRLTSELEKLQGSGDTERDGLILEAKKTYTILEQRERELHTLREDLLDTENKLEAQKSLHDDLNKIYDNKVEENKANLDLIQKLSEELDALKEAIVQKEAVIETLQSQLNVQRKDSIMKEENKFVELEHKLQELLQVNEHLKSVNQIITKEKESSALELQKSGETIKHNKIELDKMTSDIIELKESVKSNVAVIESLRQEAKSLLDQNLKLQDQFKSKCEDCSRLEMNIKTHEKTAEIQSKMIIRLQNQKEKDDKTMKDKDAQLENLIEKCTALQKEFEMVTDSMQTSREQIDELKSMKTYLETRVSELEIELENGQKRRVSLDMIVDNSRRRRQSIHDSQRMFAEDKTTDEDPNKMAAVFEARPKPDDLFMDVDDDDSNRSTPLRLSRGRESLQSRPDQSDDDPPSRPSSVLATRRRRQSIHDQHRGAMLHTPSPHGTDHSLVKLSDALTNLKSQETSANTDNGSELRELRERFTLCQQELEDLKEKYRELDEECDTCAQYLRERDEQCARLKRENTALQNQMKELTEKMKSNPNRSRTEAKCSFAHASVNTDEDWANLHAVVVDRMSFDAEVEKNKKLTRTIEELRHKKQELKITLAKMERALERHAGGREHRELEVTKSELKACKQELAELQERYRELDEECETCAEYLRERDEQCRKLREAKEALETKLQEFQDDSSLIQSVRKRRQTIHDKNRAPASDLADATTETSDDFLSYQVERDVSSQATNDTMAREMSVLKMTLDKVSTEKAALERVASAQLTAIHPAMYVATGSAIVQNQQLTDVMKENQKLKKLNAKLIHLCKKRGKPHEGHRENEEPLEQG